MTDQGSEKNEVSVPLNSSKKTREKLRRNPHRGCKTLATAAGVSKSTMHKMLRDDLGLKLFKMLHRQELTARDTAMRAKKIQRNRPGDTLRHAAEPRVHGREEIRYPAGGTLRK